MGLDIISNPIYRFYTSPDYLFSQSKDSLLPTRLDHLPSHAHIKNIEQFDSRRKILVTVSRL